MSLKPRISLLLRTKSIAFFASFIYLLANFLTGWPLLRYWNVSGGVFPDGRAILRMAECFHLYGFNVYSTAKVDDCHGYWYGSMLVRLLDFFRVGPSLSIPVGIFFLGLLSYSLVAVIWSTVKLDIHRAYILAGFLLAPPVLLLAHRGNFDTPILLLVILSIYLMCRGQLFLANFLIILSAFFKFYTAPLLVLVWLLSDRSKKYLFLILVDLGAILILLGDLSRVTHFWNGDSFKQMFGLGALTGAINETMTFQISGNLAKNLDLGILVFSLLFLFIAKRNWKVELPTEYKRQFNYLGFLFFSTVSLVSFLLGSVDYRLLYLGFSLLFLSSIFKFSSGENFAIILLTILALLLSFPSGKLNVYGDAAALALAAINIHFLVPVLGKLVSEVIQKPKLYLQNKFFGR